MQETESHRPKTQLREGVYPGQLVLLKEVLLRKDLYAGFIHRIMELVLGGKPPLYQPHYGPFIGYKQGIRQADPISPLLFNLVVDALCNMLSKVEDVGHLKGVVAHLIPDGISHL